MKRIIILALALTICASLFAQESRTDTLYVTEYYRIEHDRDPAFAMEVGSRLDSLFPIYNRYFQFDTEQIDHRLRVRILSDRRSYNTYLSNTIGAPREDFTYIHYNDPTRNNLLIFRGNESFERSLVHQGFVQFIHAFIANPPFWLREGFAIFIEAALYDEEFRNYLETENYAWLGNLKDIFAGRGNRPLSLTAMLNADLTTARNRIDVFYPQAWGLISFLLQSDDIMINRLFWDSISALIPDATLEENVEAVHQAAFRWVDPDEFTGRMVEYINSRLTFRESVEMGIASYEDGDLPEATELFSQSLNIRSDNFIPYYYLGLINYDGENYDLAEYYYSEAGSTLAQSETASRSGSNRALVLFARGVNAYAADDFVAAETFLQDAVDLDFTYREDANQLIESIVHSRTLDETIRIDDR